MYNRISLNGGASIVHTYPSFPMHTVFEAMKLYNEEMFPW